MLSLQTATLVGFNVLPKVCHAVFRHLIAVVSTGAEPSEWAEERKLCFTLIHDPDVALPFLKTLPLFRKKKESMCRSGWPDTYRDVGSFSRLRHNLNVLPAAEEDAESH